MKVLVEESMVICLSVNCGNVVRVLDGYVCIADIVLR